jgi:hypothetical protein
MKTESTDNEAAFGAYSPRTFRERMGISYSFHGTLRKKGLAPKEILIGGVRRITFEEAARWLRERENNPFVEETEAIDRKIASARKAANVHKQRHQRQPQEV